MPDAPLTRQEALALLEWQIAMGADEAIGEVARDRLSPAPAAEQADPLHTSLVPNPSSPGPLPNPPPLAGEARLGVPRTAFAPQDRKGETLTPPALLAPPPALAESPAAAAH